MRAVRARQPRQAAPLDSRRCGWRSALEAPDQLREHLDHTDEQAAGVAMERRSEESAVEQHVEDRPAFHGAAAGNGVELGLVGR